MVKLTTGLRQNLHPVLSKRRPYEIRFACVQSIRRKSRKNHNLLISKTGFRPVSWQQQSFPSDLLKSAQCAKSWESMGKYEKVCQKLRSMPKVWENVLLAIFAVQILFFFGVQYKFFGVQEKKLRAQYKLLLPYGVSFTVFCGLMYVKFLKHNTKVCCIFLCVYSNLFFQRLVWKTN